MYFDEASTFHKPAKIFEYSADQASIIASKKPETNHTGRLIISDFSLSKFILKIMSFFFDRGDNNQLKLQIKRAPAAYKHFVSIL